MSLRDERIGGTFVLDRDKGKCVETIEYVNKLLAKVENTAKQNEDYSEPSEILKSLLDEQAFEILFAIQQHLNLLETAVLSLYETAQTEHISIPQIVDQIVAEEKYAFEVMGELHHLTSQIEDSFEEMFKVRNSSYYVHYTRVVLNALVHKIETHLERMKFYEDMLYNFDENIA